VLAGAVLTGCSRVLGRAATTPRHPRVTLVMQADTDSLVQGTTLKRLLEEVLSSYTGAHTGIDVKLAFMAGYATNVPDMLAGSGPDIVADWYAPPYWSADVLLPLDELIKRDGVQVSAWSAGQMAAMRQAGKTMSLPAYFSPMVFAVRLSDWDALGRSRPDPQWTHSEFVGECQALTRAHNGAVRYGAAFDFHRSGVHGCSWIFQAFGGDMLNAARTRQTLSSAECIRAGEWMYGQLFWPGYCIERDAAVGTGGSPQFVEDAVSMVTVWDGLILELAASIQNSFRWDIYPYPSFPAGTICEGTEDFYAINARTKYPMQAWELLQWLSYDRVWQRALMKIGAMPPARNDLWEEWISTVHAIAPPLRNIGLQHLRDRAVGGQARSGEYYATQDQQMRQLATPWFQQLWANTISVPLAFSECDHQVNAALQTALAAQA
jgi:ABC-type glycerol-3-phosphate transport system substrate-binding protein